MKRALDNFPEWREANEKLGELKNEHDSLNREYQERLLAFRQGQENKDKLIAAAESLIDGGDVKIEKTITSEQVEDLSKRRKILAKAVEIQEGRIREIESKLSAEICKNVRPEYQAIAKETAIKLFELEELVEAERMLREELHDGGVKFTSHLPPCAFSGIGKKGNIYSRKYQYLSDCVDAGYLTKKEAKL